MTLARRAELAVISAREADLDDIEEMINDFVKGHPAETHSRSRSKLREAYFGASPVARLLVATRGARGSGSGVVAAIVAEISAQVRTAGGEFLHGGGSRDAEALYDASRWAGRRTNAMSRLRPSRPSPILRG